MLKFATAALACALFASNAAAADAKVDAAVKTFDEIAAAPDKLKTYCALSKKMNEIGDDEKKADAAKDEIDGYYKALGPDFESAWAAGAESKEGSPEGQQLEKAIDALDAKCT